MSEFTPSHEPLSFSDQQRKATQEVQVELGDLISTFGYESTPELGDLSASLVEAGLAEDMGAAKRFAQEYNDLSSVLIEAQADNPDRMKLIALSIGRDLQMAAIWCEAGMITECRNGLYDASMVATGEGLNELEQSIDEAYARLKPFDPTSTIYGQM